MRLRGRWNNHIFARQLLGRSGAGRYFLVRETEPHRFIAPRHARWLDGLLRVKRLSLKAALRFALSEMQSGLWIDVDRFGVPARSASKAAEPVTNDRLAGDAIEQANDEDEDFMAGRGRHAGNPADIALLAAAEPEPVEELPPGEEDEDDHAGDEQKEGK